MFINGSSDANVMIIVDGYEDNYYQSTLNYLKWILSRIKWLEISNRFNRFQLSDWIFINVYI